jgi:hypothetical protein
MLCINSLSISYFLSQPAAKKLREHFFFISHTEFIYSESYTIYRSRLIFKTDSQSALKDSHLIYDSTVDSIRQ